MILTVKGQKSLMISNERNYLHHALPVFGRTSITAPDESGQESSPVRGAFKSLYKRLYRKGGPKTYGNDPAKGLIT